MIRSPRDSLDGVAPAVRVLFDRYRGGLNALVALVGFLAMIFFVVGLVIALGSTLPALLAAVPLGISLFLTLSVVGGYFSGRVIRLVPFFRERVPGPFTLLCGTALLRESALLDRIAREQGITPLTDFLCDDPLRGGTVVWHDARTGVEALDALIDALPGRRDETTHYEKLMDDCRQWRERLSSAAELGIPFFVMVRVGDTISGHEMSLRQGDF